MAKGGDGPLSVDSLTIRSPAAEATRSMSVASSLAAFGALGLVCAGTAAQASERAEQGEAVEAEQATPESALPGTQRSSTGRWQIDVAPYVWVTGMQGRAATLPGLPAVDVDMSFRDVVKNLSFGVIGSVSARRDRLVLMADVYYARIKTSADIPSPLFSGVDVRNETFSGLIGAGYVLTAPENRLSVMATAGARAWTMDTAIDLRSPLPGLSLKTQSRKSWIDPVIGAQVGLQLTPRWSASLIGSGGGFGIASDWTWGVSGSVSYQLNRRWAIGAGYRYLAVDHRTRDGFIFDGALSGMVLGGRYRL